jgi:hypothetical protein
MCLTGCIGRAIASSRLGELVRDAVLAAMGTLLRGRISHNVGSIIQHWSCVMIRMPELVLNEEETPDRLLRQANRLSSSCKSCHASMLLNMCNWRGEKECIDGQIQRAR